jgi:hypothetical protein
LNDGYDQFLFLPGKLLLKSRGFYEYYYFEVSLTMMHEMVSKAQRSVFSNLAGPMKKDELLQQQKTTHQ